MSTDGLTIAETLRLSSVVATSMIHFFAAICSYYLERRNKQIPMLALVFGIVGWSSLTLGAATSGVGRFMPVILVGAPLLSGYLGPALFICTKQLTVPHQKVSLKWLFLGGFGTIHSVLALTIPKGLDPAIQSIVYKQPYMHPILSPIMMVHGIQLVGFIIVSTFLITRAYINVSNPDLRRTQFWLMSICWTTLVIIVFTNILPTLKVVVTEIQPALITIPIAFVGLLCIKALGEETWTIHTQRLHERNVRMDSIGRMAKGLAHDLNNVLSTILGHAEIAKLKVSGGEEHPHLEQIIGATQRAAALIERMLAYSSDHYTNAKIIDPQQSIRTIFDSVATLQKTDVSMLLELSETLPQIRIDEADLESAIQNLLQNGLNALGEGGGRITLRGAYEERTNLPFAFIGQDINGQPSLRIEIEDTGQGMSQEEASRALEPFFSTNATGKGLGLVNVLSAVKGAGGALWFQSELGVGTRFVFWVPEASGTKSTKLNSEHSNFMTPRVLLVEDDPAVAQVLKQMLGSLNMTVEHYTQSEHVLDAIDSGAVFGFDLGVLDVRLGEMDGIELGHHLLNTQNVRALLFVSGDEPGLRIKQFEGNKVHFLRKPIGLTQLKNTIHEFELLVG